MKLYSKIVFLLLFISFNSISQNEKDSALKIINSKLTDSLKLESLTLLFDEANKYEVKYFIAKKYDKIALNLLKSSDKRSQKNGIIFTGYSLYNYAQLFESQYNYPEAVNAYFKGIDFYRLINYEYGIADHLNNIALIYFKTGQIEKALDFYFQALELDLKNKRTEEIGYLYNNIGNLYTELKESDKAYEYLKKGQEIAEKLNDLELSYLIYTNLGSVFLQLNKQDSCIHYNKKSIIISKKINRYLISSIYNNISSVFSKNENYDSALYYIDVAIKEAERIDGYPEMASLMKNKATNLKILGKNKEAEKFGLIAYDLALKNKKSGTIKLCSDFLRDYYTDMKDYKKAVYYNNIGRKIKENIKGEKLRQMALKKQMEFEFSLRENKLKAEKEKNELILKNEKDKQTFIKNIFISGFVIMLIIAGIIFNNYRNKKKANTLINEQKNLLAKQHADLEEKQKEIIDSIQYAKRLQEAILVPEKYFKNYFQDSFVIYKPKDIVSGDFYWIAESDHNKIIAVADCTGHGVPGAFMSMLGYEMLQDVLLKENITTTSAALKNLDIKMTDSLNKSNKNYRDGMDIALCAFSKTSNELQYSGANRPLIKISNGVLEEFKPSKLNIGGDIDGSEKNFLQNTISTKQGDIFYLFSDGFADQFGGENNKKFSYKKLKELLLEVHLKPLHEQKIIIENTYNQWKGNNDQIDDVCLIGIKI